MLKKRLTTSDEETCEDEEPREKQVKMQKRNSKNILHKILNRSLTGYYNDSINKKSNEKTFYQIPSELRFCLKDIIPFCYLNHVFMGLSICGNFLISYNRSCCENENYDFNSGYKYELYFWVFKPHMPLQRYVSIFHKFQLNL